MGPVGAAPTAGPVTGERPGAVAGRDSEAGSTVRGEVIAGDVDIAPLRSGPELAGTSATTSSRIDWKRLAGSFSIAFRMIDSIPASMVGFRVRGGTGAS